MCINDWRAGTLIRAFPTIFSGVGADILVVSANLQRVGISFFSNNNTSTTFAAVSIDGVSAFTVGGVAGAHHHFTLATHGDLPTRRFNIEGMGAGSSGVVVEYIASRRMMAAGLDEFNRAFLPSA